MFVSTDDAGAQQVKLLDFGIARRASAGRSHGDRELFGTPLYMSPEQAQGRLGDVGAATDVWALAQLVFRLLSGRSYYPSEQVQRTLLRVAYDPLESPSQLGCHVSRTFDDWFLRSCDRDPTARYPSVAEQVEVLCGILENGEVRLALCEERPGLICDGEAPTVSARQPVTLGSPGWPPSARSLSPAMHYSPERRRVAFVVATLMLVLMASSAARADAFAAVGAGLFLPPSGGKLGGALHVDAAHEWRIARLTFAPGLRLSAYLGPDDAFAGLVSARSTLHGSIASPHLLFAIGLAKHEGPALAVQAGAGLTFAVAPRLRVGGEGSYGQLGYGSFRSFYLGPMLQLAW